MSVLGLSFKDKFLQILYKDNIDYTNAYHKGEKIIDRLIEDIYRVDHSFEHTIGSPTTTEEEKFIINYFKHVYSIAEKIINEPSIPYLLSPEEYKSLDLIAEPISKIYWKFSSVNFNDNEILVFKELMSNLIDRIKTIDSSTYYACLCAINYLYHIRIHEDMQPYEECYIVNSLDDAITKLPLVANIIYLKEECKKINQFQIDIRDNITSALEKNKFYIAAQKLISDVKELNNESLGLFELDNREFEIQLCETTVSLRTFESHFVFQLDFGFGSNTFIDYSNPDRIISAECMPFGYTENEMHKDIRFKNSFNLIDTFNKVMKSCRLINEAQIGTKFTDPVKLLNTCYGPDVYISIDEYKNSLKRYETILLANIDDLCECIYKSTLEIFANYK